ncbi:MAG: alanine--tRNA ligase, partial [Oscillospiraceae bacterium]
ELNFNRTIDRGMKLLDDLIAEMQEKGETVLKGEDCFKLSDTHGFPIDLTREILEEKGMTVDEEGYYACMEIQRTTAREARGGSKYMGADETVFHRIDKEFTTEFLGYDSTECDGVLDYLANDDELIMKANTGDKVYIVPSQTVFYAESGGQVGDTGIITTATGKAEVKDVQKAVGGKFAHTAVVTEGYIEAGQQAHFAVDAKRRMAIARNHSAAHLLQAALREVLGDHVHQKGQLVDADRVRFDFSHFEAITLEELNEIEKLVNEKIMDCIDISTQVLPIEEAQKLGAMALFGEKYGETVRVVSMGDFSMEFCGGTHLTNASQAGLFKIISESSVASGVRRIEAVTGSGVLRLFNEVNNRVAAAAKVLKLNDPALLADRIVSMLDENKELGRLSEELKKKVADSIFSNMIKHCREVNGVKVMANMMSNIGSDMYEKFADAVKNMNEPFLLVMAGTADEKPKFLCACSKAAVAKGAHAGKIVKEVSAITGGKGGGRPDMAMAGIGDKNKIDEALHAVDEILASIIKA